MSWLNLQLEKDAVVGLIVEVGQYMDALASKKPVALPLTRVVSIMAVCEFYLQRYLWLLEAQPKPEPEPGQSPPKAEEGKMMNIELNGRVLNPRELTMREIIRVLKDLENSALHPLERECPDEPISAMAVSISTDIPFAELLDLTPSQAKELFAQVRAKNPTLARKIEQLGSPVERFLSGDQG